MMAMYGAGEFYFALEVIDEGGNSASETIQIKFE
jgi:hypothetical protein